MKIKSFFAVLALAVCLATATFAQDQYQGKEMPPKQEQVADNHKPRFEHKNMFTDEQKEAFKTVRINSMKEAKPLQDQLRELKAHQQTLMTEEKPDMNAIYANIDKMSKLENQLAKIRAKTRVEIQSHLTDEQKLQMQNFRTMRNHDHGPKDHPDRPHFMEDQI